MTVLALDGRRRRGRLSRRCAALPAGAAGALLPHDRIAARRRGSGPGNLPAGVEVLRRVPGQIVGAHVAVPDRHQHLPDRAGRAQAPAAADRAGRPGVRSERRHRRASRDRLAGAAAGGAAGASVGSVGDRRIPRVGAAGVHRRAAASVPAAARRPGAARGVAVEGRRGGRGHRRVHRRGEQPAAAGPRPTRREATEP